MVVDLMNSIDGQIILRWVKAHAGHSGNEQADSLAKIGCYQDLPEEPTPFPKHLIRNIVLSKIRTIWDSEWNNYPLARQRKHFCSGQNQKRAKEICQLSRFRLGRLIHVVTGHNGFNANRHNVDSEIPNACRLCQQEPESFLHFITTCTFLSQERSQIFQKSFTEPHVWDVEEVLEFSHLPLISPFMDRHGFYSSEYSCFFKVMLVSNLAFFQICVCNLI